MLPGCEGGPGRSDSLALLSGVVVIGLLVFLVLFFEFFG